MYATKIKLKPGCTSPTNTLEISEIFIEGCANPGYYTKESLYNYLYNHPNSIRVKVYPYPYLIPAISKYGEKYVKSQPNHTQKDNLLELPHY